MLLCAASSVLGVTATSATSPRSQRGVDFVVPWTTGRGSRVLARFVLDGSIGANLACHGPGRLTLRLSSRPELVSLRCPRSGVASSDGGSFPPRKARSVVASITAPPAVRWIVEIDQERRYYSGTVTLPLGPLNRFMQRYR